jgi:hypothetical protein
VTVRTPHRAPRTCANLKDVAKLDLTDPPPGHVANAEITSTESKVVECRVCHIAASWPKLRCIQNIEVISANFEPIVFQALKGQTDRPGQTQIQTVLFRTAQGITTGNITPN